MMHEMNSALDGSPLREISTRVALTTFALLLAGPATLLARPSTQTTFASPEDASRALLGAVQKHDERTVTEILGTKGELVSSGDKLQDTLERERFVQKYEQMHRFVQEPGGVTALYIGAENWPFPIPRAITCFRPTGKAPSSSAISICGCAIQLAGRRLSLLPTE